jgi:hypothetical protein
LLLDKVDFAVNGYEVDERKYLRNLGKTTTSSSMEKKIVKEYIDLFDDNIDDNMVAEDNSNALGDDLFLNNKFDDKEELEAETEEDLIPLEGIQLGGVTVGEEKSDELKKAWFKATPWISFGYKGQLD